MLVCCSFVCLKYFLFETADFGANAEGCIHVLVMHHFKTYQNNCRFQNITVTNTNFIVSDRTKGLYIDSDSHSRRDFVRVVGNTFTSSDRQCLYIINARQMWLEENTFSSIADTAVSITQNSPQTVMIRSNTFQQSVRALYLNLRYSAPNDALTIVNNRFVDHTGGPVVQLQFSSYKATSDIRDNIFQNNTGNGAVMVYVSNSDATSTESVSVIDNIFDNPSAAYDLKVNIPYSEGHTMYAVRNWWGGQSTSHVQNRIFDHSSDSSKAKVEYEPYRLTRETNSLSQTSSGFVRDNGTIGGIVKEETVLEKRDTKYIVEEDIVVPRGVTLTIEAGVVLVFRRGGITVDGKSTH